MLFIYHNISGNQIDIFKKSFCTKNLVVSKDKDISKFLQNISTFCSKLHTTQTTGLALTGFFLLYRAIWQTVYSDKILVLNRNVEER